MVGYSGFGCCCPVSILAKYGGCWVPGREEFCRSMESHRAVEVGEKEMLKGATTKNWGDPESRQAAKPEIDF